MNRNKKLTSDSVFNNDATALVFNKGVDKEKNEKVALLKETPSKDGDKLRMNPNDVNASSSNGTPFRLHCVFPANARGQVHFFSLLVKASLPMKLQPVAV